jgi:pyruvate dehydrogenase E2 component (dihydrolipoamide acetyltransferase)
VNSNVGTTDSGRLTTDTIMAQPGQSFDGTHFLLPDLGEGLEEAEIIEWLIEEGQTVEDGDPLALVETGKAQTEVYTPRTGTVTKLHGGPGDTVKVGAPLVEFGDDDNPQQATDDGPDDQASSEAAAEASDPAAREDEGTVVGSLGAAAGMGEAGKPLAAPAVRRLARDAGVDLQDVAGTGIGGRITADDVRKAAARKPESPAHAPSNGRHRQEPVETPPAPRPVHVPAGEETVRIPYRGTRRTIANRLRESVDKAVHFTVMDEADVTALDAQRKKLITAVGEKISLLPFVCTAVARVLSGEFGLEMRRLNSVTDDAADEIIQHNRVHLGLAVDTPGGLMVPRIADANTLGVFELGRKIADLADACRNRSIAAGDLQGSTFTVSNFGSYAGRFATPVINYPEVGILAVGRAREGVVVRNGLMGVGKVLPLSLTCDHRAVDGGTATMALNAIIKLLQDPASLLPQ